MNMLKKDKSTKADISLKLRCSFENIILILAVTLVIGLYWRWALPGVITYGDWWHETQITLMDYSLSLWSSGGFGGYSVLATPILPIQVFSGYCFWPS